MQGQSSLTGQLPLQKSVVIRLSVLLLAAFLATLAGCNNNPQASDVAASNTLTSAVIESSPRHLDPTASYWSNDTPYTYQIYEPLYGYHYLKRPFELVPKAASAVVKPTFIGKDGKPLPEDVAGELVVESVYDIPIKQGIKYQPHPAFAQLPNGSYAYHAMKPGELGKRRTPLEFEQSGTRELVAEDFVYALKRHHTHHNPHLRHLRRVRRRLERVRRSHQSRRQETACGARRGQPRQTFPRLPALAFGGCHRARKTPAAHTHQRQIPTVELLDGDDLFGAGSVGSRCF
jgi:ABC-type transport system substrate-binding protein